MESSHNWDTLLIVKPSTPILFICLIITIISLFRVSCPDFLRKRGFSISSNILEVDENLPNFFETLKISEREWFIAENEWMK